MINSGIGEAEDIEETRSELNIEPPISDKDWTEFIGKKEADK